MSARSSIYIAFGANLASPHDNFVRAVLLLQRRGVKLSAASGLWQSPAWPAGTSQPDYINACARVEFDGAARQLLSLLHEVEAEMGRKRGALNTAREIDLDLIDFKGQIISSADIIIPHPRLIHRGFVLFPLSQIAPNWIDPNSERSIDQLIARLSLETVRPMRALGRRSFI